MITRPLPPLSSRRMNRCESAHPISVIGLEQVATRESAVEKRTGVEMLAPRAGSIAEAADYGVNRALSLSGIAGRVGEVWMP